MLYTAETGGVVSSCAELSCYFGAVCTERTGGALCECAAAPCPDSDTNMLVSVLDHIRYVILASSVIININYFDLSSYKVIF